MSPWIYGIVIALVVGFLIGYKACAMVVAKTCQDAESVFYDKKKGRWFGQPKALAAVAKQVEDDNAEG